MRRIDWAHSRGSGSTIRPKRRNNTGAQIPVAVLS